MLNVGIFFSNNEKTIFSVASICNFFPQSCKYAPAIMGVIIISQNESNHFLQSRKITSGNKA